MLVGGEARVPSLVGSELRLGRGLGVFLPAEAPALSAAYTDELGAAGGAGLEDEASALRLEDSEHPPMILRTD